MLKKSRFCVAALLSLVMIFTLCSSAFAATVGQNLTTPETGWQRFDDTDSHLTYVGTWGTFSGAPYYKGALHTNVTPDSSLAFKFYGTKLRIITDGTPTHTNNVKISIDGKEYIYTQIFPSGFQYIAFEKTGLTLGYHNVMITTTTTVPTTIDAIDIDDVGSLHNADKAIILAALGEKSQIVLSWNAIPTATQYNIKKSTHSGGPYTTIASNVTSTTYTDTNVTNGTTYYYVVSAVTESGESANSNEASATPQDPVVQPETGRAILTITLDTGIEKEYDLSMAEVNSFISWYEGKATGSGTASYAIDKHDNNKGPFKNRKDYFIFDKILTFEVNEYEVTE